MRKTAIIDMNELFRRTVRIDMKTKVEIVPKKQYCKIIWIMLLIVVVFYIGYQIGCDAARRDDRQNSMIIERSN